MFKIMYNGAEYWFVLKSKNGQVIATSEMYPSAHACKKGIMAVKRTAAKAKIKEVDK